jgi:serine O-acetyltransferase
VGVSPLIAGGSGTQLADVMSIYAGATILGRITIGRGSVMGGNLWLTQSVSPGSNVVQAQMRTSTMIQPKSFDERIGQWSI